MSTQLKLGAKVRTLRRREGLTQSDLAAKLEISPSYLNLIEHNQRPLPAHLLLRVAQVLKADTRICCCAWRKYSRRTSTPSPTTARPGSPPICRRSSVIRSSRTIH